MAWQKLDSVTLGSTNTTLGSGTFTAKKFIQAIIHRIGLSSTMTPIIRFNADTGSNYALRESQSGGADGTAVTQTSLYGSASGVDASDELCIAFLNNITTEEKLGLFFFVNRNTAGAGTAPQRREMAGKWTNTSNQITSDALISDNANTFGIGSNITNLGTDGGEVNYLIQDGCIFEETDTNKHYQYNSTTGLWTYITQ